MALLVNAGCGPAGHGRLPAMFDNWEQLRVDVDADVRPDIIASITDLSAIPDGYADALWTAHCIEHLYIHEVGFALGEIYRVLSEDGFGCITVPDLQAIANLIGSDKLHEVIYQSPAGPITAHDMIYGFGAAIARGQVSMAHRCGFTPSMLMRCLQEHPFGEIILHRRPQALELVAVVRKRREPYSREERAALMAALEL
jgi:hypothetical protein